MKCILLAVLTSALGSIVGPDAYAFQAEWSPELSIALPQPLQVGTEFGCLGDEFLCSPKLKFYLDGGYFQLGLGSGSKELNLYSFESGARYQPFSFPIYFSLGMGYRHIAFSADMSAFKLDNSSVASTANLDLSTLYFTPGLGFNFNLTRNLSLGMDLGVQIPVIASGRLWLYDDNTGLNSDTSPELQTDSGKAMDRIAGLIIPKLTLVRLTWTLD